MGCHSERRRDHGGRGVSYGRLFHEGWGLAGPSHLEREEPSRDAEEKNTGIRALRKDLHYFSNSFLNKSVNPLQISFFSENGY